MADCPTHLASEHRLADGRRVTIRPIEPADEAAERAFFAGLCERSRRMRFPKSAKGVPDGLIDSFTHIDYDRHMAFVCEAADRDAGKLVGEARYVANPDGRSCELGIVVADDWHHTGVAQLLLAALIDAARAHGLESMDGLVLRGNRDMLDFARTFGFTATAAAEDPSIMRIARKL
jgi:acetyltransferase